MLSPILKKAKGDFEEGTPKACRRVQGKARASQMCNRGPWVVKTVPVPALSHTHMNHITGSQANMGFPHLPPTPAQLEKALEHQLNREKLGEGVLCLSHMLSLVKD